MKKNEKSRMEQILAPTNCPSCEGELKFINELLYCFDKMCPAQWDKKMEHFSIALWTSRLKEAILVFLVQVVMKGSLMQSA